LWHKSDDGPETFLTMYKHELAHTCILFWHGMSEMETKEEILQTYKNEANDDVIDEFDLSEAGSEIEDTQKKVDNVITENTNGPLVNTENNTTQSSKIRTMLSNEAKGGLAFESIDVSDDDHEEDENKKATVAAIKRIASVGGFNDLVKLEGSIRQTRRKHLAKLRTQSNFIGSPMSPAKKKTMPKRKTRGKLFMVSNEPQDKFSVPGRPIIDLSTSLDSTSNFAPKKARTMKRLSSSSNFSIHNSTTSIPDFRDTMDDEIEEVTRRLSSGHAFDIDNGKSILRSNSNSFAKRSGSFLSRSNSIHNIATQVQNLRETDVAQRAKKCVLEFNMTYNSVFVVFILCALYLDDLRVAFMPAEADIPVFIMSCIIFGLLWLEVIISSFLVEWYLNSNFFWLDVITATVTFPFEIMHQDNMVLYDNEIGFHYSFISRSAHIYQILRSIKAAALSLKASNNIAEIVDSTLYGNKQHDSSTVFSIGNENSSVSSPVFQETQPNIPDKKSLNKIHSNNDVNKTRKLSADDFGLSPLKSSLTRAKLGVSPTVRARRRSSFNVQNEYLFIRENEESLNDVTKDSIIGEKLVKLTKIKTLVVTTIILFAVSLFGDIPYYNYMDSFGLELLHTTHTQVHYLNNPLKFKELYANRYIMAIEKCTTKSSVIFSPKRSILHLQVGNMTIITKEKKLRSYDTLNIKKRNSLTEIRLDVYEINQTLAVMSIFISTITFLALLSWEKTLRVDYKRNIVDPIYNIIGALGRLAADPRLAVQLAEKGGNFDNGDSPTEIVLIGKAIAKFGHLLNIGFGEAGVEIISRNLRQGHGEFNPVAKGKKINAIFGFCDIRNFTDLCEVLRQETMVFTNKVAEIVHNECHRADGDVNKNIGDAFLLVWKVKSVLVEQKDRTHSSFTGVQMALKQAQQSANKSSRRVVKAKRRRASYVHHLSKKENIVDEALQAFIKIREILDASDHVQEYSNNPQLQERIPNFKIRLGYGLHVGWAIEGAIGSRYKVDASYLSPHVNIAARLEAATKQYGVSMLLSEAFYNQLSEETKSQCRPLDRVTLKGSAVPMNLYTHDLQGNQSNLPVNVLPESRKNFPVENTTNANIPLWKTIFMTYIGGFWEKCKEDLIIYRTANPDDSPSLVLWDFLRSQNFVMPEEWKNQGKLFNRSLTRK
jgi:class 3 adenylate cyclase